MRTAAVAILTRAPAAGVPSPLTTIPSIEGLVCPITKCAVARITKQARYRLMLTSQTRCFLVVFTKPISVSSPRLVHRLGFPMTSKRIANRRRLPTSYHAVPEPHDFPSPALSSGWREVGRSREDDASPLPDSVQLNCNGGDFPRILHPCTVLAPIPGTRRPST